MAAVPQAPPAAAVAAVARLLRGRRVVVLAGAGVSTESGIPDYRGAGRSPRRTIQYRDFVTSPAIRARYWARSAAGWPRLAAARPNAGHLALAALEAAGVAVGVITQNVDGLHAAAGSRQVVELHGALARVRCLGCDAVLARAEVQAMIEAANPGLAAAAAAAAPDGDAELEPPADLAVPACPGCGGVLKPDVVLFGEHVPAPVVGRAWELFERADALLVVGSSLAVFSGYRFVVRAAERQVPVAIVNLGPTRGDAMAAIKLEAPLGQALPALVAALAG
ncbi:MAG: NAD-dependent protein deacetylase [Kofleriaceae bacterium]|nr:NAD-dependent protein deacetylase [Kofleriaceae bacterium]MCL4223710.1 NAD-dependent protein deacetylase [Myxococcales bacterium]